jgi:hypothetical protein
MATPILEKTSKDLAYKLQDPVSAGTENGQRISAAERLRYIIRGYRRLLRIVTLLHPRLISRLFQRYYDNVTGTTSSGGALALTNISEIHEVLAKEPAQEFFVRATFSDPQDWLSIENGVNVFYYPNLNSRQYYWTQLEGNLYVVPPVTYHVRMSIRQDWITLVENGGYGGIYDLDVPTEHIDLILSLAGYEAYLDLGQPDMAGAYMTDFEKQFATLLGNYQKAERKDETD